MVVGIMAARLGTKHHFAKLNPELVREARKRYYTERISFLDLSLEYDVGVTTMRTAVLGITWSHVRDDDGS
jgi:hypothetical protein